MIGHSMCTKRYAFVLLVSVAVAILFVSGYYGTLPASVQGYVYRKYSPSRFYDNADNLTAGYGGGAREFRYDNGLVRVTNSQFRLDPDRLVKLGEAKLEDLYEQVVLEVTAECSTTRRLGRAEDGGWNLCLVGPFTPQQPCFSFSFGVNNIWEFDDEVASKYACQVLTFDPTMQQESHLRSERVAFLKEGLHAARGSLNSWSVDSYLGFLKRFRAENFTVDILKMDIEFSEWPALETAVRDGSLQNVKQLLLETHVDKAASAQQYLGYFAVLRALHDLGFRLWHYNWNTFGNYASLRRQNLIRTCCHELYYINVKYLGGNRSPRNLPGSRIAMSVTGKISKIIEPNLQELQAARQQTQPETQLEAVYFRLVEQQHLLCPNSVRIGDALDGGWDVCFTDPFDIRKSRPCVAFSFGINGVWAYDDQLAETYGCQVYMFDPSMTSVSDHQRKKTSWFYRTGLSSENKVDASSGWKMRTLCTLFNELGYSGKTVDILKIDVEHWEWSSFEKAFQEGCLTRVKQLLFESHTSELVRQRTDYGRLLRIWQGLFDLGFRTWKWHKNPQSLFFTSDSKVNRACCYEHYMLNTKLVAL